MFFKKNKRGNAIIDTTIFIGVLFVVAVSWLIIGYISNELNTDIQADDTLDAESKALADDFNTDYSNIFDNAILLFFILFWGMTLVASFMIDTHPVFFIFSFILLILMFGVVVGLGNAFNEIFTEDIPGLSADYPKTFWIFNNLLVISIVIGLTVLLSLFARPKA